MITTPYCYLQSKKNSLYIKSKMPKLSYHSMRSPFNYQKKSYRFLFVSAALAFQCNISSSPRNSIPPAPPASTRMECVSGPYSPARCIYKKMQKTRFMGLSGICLKCLSTFFKPKNEPLEYEKSHKSTQKSQKNTQKSHFFVKNGKKVLKSLHF